MDKREKVLEKEHTEKSLKKKFNRYGTLAVIAATVVVAIIVLTVLVVNAHNKNKELEAALAETADSLERQKKLAEDLEAYNGEQKSELQKLQDKIDELLNVEEPAPVITTAQIKEQLSSVRELVTQKYIYTNAERGEYSKTWLWGWDMPFGDKSILVKYDGTIKAGIDLNAVDIDVNEDSRTITVTLPASEIMDHNVPQDTIQTYEARDGLFNKVMPDDSNALIDQGKQEMEAKAIERGLLAEADREAEAVVRAFLSILPGMDTYTLNVVTK
ncbi:MAG: DUF4230 domain-containing protein [Oscillospiraceae bacterium]|nr:DUF4230 domain-containing protein [Oscillospiraceae bacterium]